MSNADPEKQKLVLETLAKHLMRALHTSNGSNTEFVVCAKHRLKAMSCTVCQLFCTKRKPGNCVNSPGNESQSTTKGIK